MSTIDTAVATAAEPPRNPGAGATGDLELYVYARDLVDELEASERQRVDLKVALDLVARALDRHDPGAAARLVQALHTAVRVTW